MFVFVRFVAVVGVRLEAILDGCLVCFGFYFLIIGREPAP